MRHLIHNNIIHEHQFGFQKNKSTYMPILLLQEIVTKAFEHGEFTLGVFLDIKKAFDTVHINILLQKLQRYGVKHTAFEMLSSYLYDRKQSVKIHNTYSSLTKVKMGVPQGSILGPLLFLLYINDLPLLSSDMTCLSYADDTAIIFKSKDLYTLQTTVNMRLALINDWFNANYLTLNASKTYTQLYTTRFSSFKLDIHLSDKPIEEKENVKYLGIFIDKSLKFNKHIHYISTIVSRNIGIISRVRHCLDTKITHLLYNTLILPYLNYCCIIWGSNYDSQLQKLFILQKRAVRLIEHIYPPQSSEPIFKKYKILKVKDIAKSQMLLVMHKFITNQLPKVFDNLYSLYPSDTSNTRHIPHLEQPFSNRNYRLFTSSCLGPKLWNSIITPTYRSLNDVPASKYVVKKLIREYFITTYSSAT